MRSSGQKSYSSQEKLKITGEVRAGASHRSILTKYSISVSSLIRWTKDHAFIGSQIGGAPKSSSRRNHLSRLDKEQIIREMWNGSTIEECSSKYGVSIRQLSRWKNEMVLQDNEETHQEDDRGGTTFDVVDTSNRFLHPAVNEESLDDITIDDKFMGPFSRIKEALYMSLYNQRDTLKRHYATMRECNFFKDVILVCHRGGQTLVVYFFFCT
jgi:transposase-like protein